MSTAEPTLLASATSPRPELRAAGMAPDILGPVLGVGRSGVRVGAGLGILFAALLHGYMVVRVYSALYGMEGFIRHSRKEIGAWLNAFGPEIDTTPVETKKEEPKPAVKEEQVEEEPEPVETKPVVHEQPPQQQQPQQQEPPPEPSRSIYADDKPVGGGGETERSDYTQDGPLTPAGSGGGLGGGKGAGIGKGTGPGTGKPPPAPTPPPAPAADLSQPASLLGGKSWNCPFPPEADAEGRDSATVTLVVTVGTDGSAEKVSIMADPGSGFGRAARSCALGRRYKSGLDREGKPSRKTTAPITVRFSR